MDQRDRDHGAARGGRSYRGETRLPRLRAALSDHADVRAGGEPVHAATQRILAAAEGPLQCAPVDDGAAHRRTWRGDRRVRRVPQAELRTEAQDAAEQPEEQV